LVHYVIVTIVCGCVGAVGGVGVGVGGGVIAIGSGAGVVIVNITSKVACAII
jgi:hypothetical protein